MSQEEVTGGRQGAEVGPFEATPCVEEILDQVERQLRDHADSGCSCDEVADRLFELLDAQMPREQEERLRKHLEFCPHCNRLAEAENHVREILKRSCCESAPSTLRVRITQQIAIHLSTM